MKRLLLAAALALLVAPAAASASVTVTTAADTADNGCTPDDCTLREAITTPPPDGLIIVPARTYTVDSELVVAASMEIRGAGARTTTIRYSAAGFDRVMRIDPDVGSVTVSGVRITGGNDDENQGGGINVGTASTLHLFDSAVEDNTGAEGGGIWSAGTLDVRRSTIARNHAVAPGGANGGGILAVAGGSTTLENTTVSRNTARDNDSGGHGGGIYTSANLDLRNVTITENEAGSGVRGDGGGLFQDFGSSPLLRTVATNIVIARNVGLNCWGTGTHQVQATNSVGDEANISGGPSCNASLPTNLLVADARLGPLATNGGSTDTHALLTGSPAIDKGGACPATDQRGISRPRGAACDAGAYELVQPPSSPPPEEPLPPPKPGKTVNALTKSGTVKIKLPGSNRFIVLGAGQQIPTGTIVDTRKGRVTLIAASNKTGGTASAVFYDGLFKVTQSKGAKPITTLTLVEKLTGCKVSSGNASAAAKKKKKRRLWGDGKGRFRTKGQYSSATVRGTKWLVEDRCVSTLTRVVRGKVEVRDFVKKKTVLVKAGKKYVAKRR